MRCTDDASGCPMLILWPSIICQSFIDVQTSTRSNSIWCLCTYTDKLWIQWYIIKLEFLAVELMSQHDWILKKECHFQNHLTFVSSFCSIEMIGHFHFLEVRVRKETEDLDCPTRQECCLVKESFELSIADVLSSYEHTKGTSFALGFYCPCPPSAESRPHFCKFIPNTQMICSKTESFHSLGNRAISFREVC